MSHALTSPNLIIFCQYLVYECIFPSHLSAGVFYFIYVLYMSSAERAVGEGERMLEVLQRWGQHRAEVRFFLRHNRAPSRESGKCPSYHVHI